MHSKSSPVQAAAKYVNMLTMFLSPFSEQRTMHRNDVQPYIVPTTEISDVIGTS